MYPRLTTGCGRSRYKFEPEPRSNTGGGVSVLLRVLTTTVSIEWALPDALPKTPLLLL
jgi:hypothetical protein